MMRRHVARLLIFLLLGAAYSVVVAWWYAGTRVRVVARPTGAATYAGGEYWDVAVWRSQGCYSVNSVRRTVESDIVFRSPTRPEAVLPKYLGIDRSEPPTIDAVAYEQTLITAAGWPLPCLRTVVRNTDPTQENQVVSWGDGLPFRPIAIPMIVNSLFWAVMIFVAWSLVHLVVLRRIVRHRRLRRGRCPACNYPIGRSTRCTECGDEIPVPPA